MTPRWLTLVFTATLVVFAGVVIYVYGLRFSEWAESDAAVQVVLATKSAPVAPDWYYANGDIWVVAPHLIGVLAVALLGLGPASLWVTVVVGFSLELVIFVACYRRLGAEGWVAIVAAAVTLIAWSNGHVAYEYIQLAYGWGACIFIVAFTWFAVFADGGSSWLVVWAAAVVAMFAMQNPMRNVVFIVVPTLVGCAWPWRELAARRRVIVAATVVGACVVGYGIRALLIAPAVQFSVPVGHVAFQLGDLADNLSRFARGLVFLTGGAHNAVRAIPGIAVLVGAIALVARDIFESRAFSTRRFVAVIVLAQLAAVAGPLVIGNLLDGVEAIRYLMSSLVLVFGLAVVNAVRMLHDTSRWRRVAMAWLIALPIAAAVAALDAKPPHPRKYIWPDTTELSAISTELVHRGLSRGFSINLAASLLTMDSHGAAKTCPVTFRDRIRPQRWLADTACFDAATLPDRFFVVIYQADGQDHVAAAATLPSPAERFTVGPTYEVYVYRTADTSTGWLGDSSP